MGFQEHTERTRRTLGLAALGLAAVLAPAAAWADFGNTLRLSPTGQTALDPQVAINADGDALVVWRGGDGTNGWVRARSRSATGALGPLFDFVFAPGSSFAGPQIAMNADGDALVVWARSAAGEDRIQARARSQTGALSTPQFLSAPGAFALKYRVAIDRDGDALVVWLRDDETGHRRVQARSRSSTGALGRVQTLSLAGAHADNPQVAMDADGDALVVWQHDDSNAGNVDPIHGRARSRTGAFGPLLTLSNAAPGNPHALNPQVSMDSEGDAVVVWHDLLGIQARARSRTGVLGSIQRLSANGTEPRVVLDSDGDALVVWTGNDDGISLIRARARSKSGALGPIQKVSQAGHGPQVASDVDGDSVVAWMSADKVFARTRSKTGTLGPIQPLAGGGFNPQIAVDADGSALAVWIRHDGSHWRTQGAAGP